jgi:hypothetical protein
LSVSFTGRFAAALIAAVSARIFRRAAAAFGDVQFFAAVFEPEPQAASSTTQISSAVPLSTTTPA